MGRLSAEHAFGESDAWTGLRYGLPGPVVDPESDEPGVDSAAIPDGHGTRGRSWRRNDGMSSGAG